MSSMGLYGKLYRSIVNEPSDGGFSCIDFFEPTHTAYQRDFFHGRILK